jgi:hypothetical protein
VASRKLGRFMTQSGLALDVPDHYPLRKSKRNIRLFR